MSAELKPCPSCGHVAHVTYGFDIRFEYGSSGWKMKMWRAECGSRDLCGADTFTRHTREGAVKSWNEAITRAALAHEQPAGEQP